MKLGKFLPLALLEFSLKLGDSKSYFNKSYIKPNKKNKKKEKRKRLKRHKKLLKRRTN